MLIPQNNLPNLSLIEPLGSRTIQNQALLNQMASTIPHGG